ncbi:C4-dicarboxylate ABC transporter substrate-binding protein [Sulfuricella sp. T08]|uniref:TAXI family TRAP transporter solute-binding subunit n=1 Tax=Sulfuricella sp. T08 TaxID=1632857 RepID=UPI000617A1AC|nr:TAXI family TRAP transporter solute-binding subunit [Sulfuricella sp. T08]GAO36088.1 C4-dicarboxylate ABC transporter substrate-binding protein [Sulfuricella sp. T08]
MKNPFSNKSLREMLVVALPALALIIALFWIASMFVQPAPPKLLYMTTGSESGAYHAYAKQYKEILARHGITLELRTSSGALENLQRLKDSSSHITIGFIQGGTATAEDGKDLMSLGSMYYEPLWVFYRSKAPLDRVAQLRGKKLAGGAEGSGTRKLALQILAANDMNKEGESLAPLAGDAVAEAIRQGTVDAAFIIAGADSAVVHKLLSMDGVRLMHFAQAGAYVKRFPFLSQVTLPRGAVDLVRDIPEQDVTLIAATANLVARNDIHPALVSLLAQATSQVHGEAGMFQQAKEFPAFKDVTFEISKDAERYYKSGPPFLQRYLPFWAAVLVDRILVMALPLLVLIPILRAIPALYRWRITSRIYRWYGELSALENEIKSQYEPARYANFLAQIESMEDRANNRPIPVAYAHLRYTLREHINLVRASLERKRAEEKSA